MIQSDLDLARDHAVVRSRQALDLLAHDGSPEARTRGLFELSAQHRVLAIADLLQRCDVDAWVFHLCASAQALLELHEQAAAGTKLLPRYLCGSKNIGLSAALAAGDLETARRLARVSPEHHDERFEYEDDFLLFRFMQLALDRPAAADEELQAVIDRWEVVLEGGNSSAMEVCRALVQSDDDAFAEAFEELLATRDERLAELAETPSVDPKVLAPEGNVFVEGLALLRLAELRGIATGAEYRYLPSVARVPALDASPHPGAWRHAPS